MKTIHIMSVKEIHQLKKLHELLQRLIDDPRVPHQSRKKIFNSLKELTKIIRWKVSDEDNEPPGWAEEEE